MNQSLRNPYHHIPPKERIVVQARVSTDDYKFLRQLFPMKTGVVDKVLATLYSKLIHELKSAGLDSANPDHQAWHNAHPTDTVLLTVLSEFQRRAPGQSAGTPGPRNVKRGTRRIHQTDGGDAEQRADAKGGG